MSILLTARQVPFQLSFFSDNWENAGTNMLEASQTRSGFQLNYVQSATNCWFENAQEERLDQEEIKCSWLQVAL